MQTCAAAAVGLLHDQHGDVAAQHAVVVVQLAYHGAEAVLAVKGEEAQGRPFVQKVSAAQCRVSAARGAGAGRAAPPKRRACM